MDARGLSAAAQCAFCQAAGGCREGLRGGRSWAPERDAVHRGGTRGGPGQHGGLCRFKVAAAGEQDASPLRQGAREGARISARQARCLPRTAVPVPLRSAGPPDRRPDSRQFGLVVDAVKAWPGSAATCRTPRATASLDCVSTRGRWRAMGRDEETGSQVEQRNWTQSCGSRMLTSKTAPGVRSAFPRIAATKSGQLMCYENRTTAKATDSASFSALPPNATGLRRLLFPLRPPARWGRPRHAHGLAVMRGQKRRECVNGGRRACNNCRHARACPAHPRLLAANAWVAGPSPAMTKMQVS